MIKAQNRDALLFYRMGDFYEMFFDDAVAASEALDIALTKRGKHLGEDIPMCGVPAHSAESYFLTLIRKPGHIMLYIGQHDGQPVVLQSRATDESGRVQPARAALLAERGRHGYFHYNAIVSWAVTESGFVEHTYVDAEPDDASADPFGDDWAF